MIPLSTATRDRLETLFEGAELVEAQQLLYYECAEKQPLSNDATPESLERVRFAALKVSEGDLEELRRAVAWARVDATDLLLWAGFHRDPKEHLDWFPEPRFENG